MPIKHVCPPGGVLHIVKLSQPSEADNDQCEPHCGTAYLAGSSKQQTGNSLLDIITAIDVWSYHGKDELEHIRLCCKRFELCFFLQPVNSVSHFLDA